MSTTTQHTPPAVSVAVRSAAIRLIHNDKLLKELQREIEADKALVKAWGEGTHTHRDGNVTVSAVEGIEVDPEVARELLGTRVFNSKVRSEKVDLAKWREADIPDDVRAKAETPVTTLRLRVHN